MIEYIIYGFAIFGLIIGSWILYGYGNKKIRTHQYSKSEYKNAEFKGDKLKLSANIYSGYSDYDYDYGEKEICIEIHSKYGGYQDTIRIPEHKWRKWK